MTVEERKGLFLAAAVAVGGIAIGKAGVDHVLASRSAKPIGEFDKTEVDYSARRTPVQDDLVAFAASIAGFWMLVAGAPAAWQELKKLLP